MKIIRYLLCLFLVGCSQVPENLRGNFICSWGSVSVTANDLRFNDATFTIDKVEGNIIHAGALSFDPVLSKLYRQPEKIIEISDCKKVF